MFEAAVIAVGVLSLLTVVTLRQPGATGAEADALRVVGQSLVGVRDWTFLLGPNVMAGLNALLLGTLLYRSGLVPRVIPTLGLIGAPLLLAVTLATTFGLTEHGSAWWILVAPIFVWELSLGIYLLLKGFTHPSVPTSTRGDTKTTKSRRTLELPARCVQALGEHRAFMAGSGRPTGDDDLVFASQTGTALDAANVRTGVPPGCRYRWPRCR
jgi:hypothetical protein